MENRIPPHFFVSKEEIALPNYQGPIKLGLTEWLLEKPKVFWLNRPEIKPRRFEKRGWTVKPRCPTKILQSAGIWSGSRDQDLRVPRSTSLENLSRTYRSHGNGLRFFTVGLFHAYVLYCIEAEQYRKQQVFVSTHSKSPPKPFGVAALKRAADKKRVLLVLFQVQKPTDPEAALTVWVESKVAMPGEQFTEGYEAPLCFIEKRV